MHKAALILFAVALMSVSHAAVLTVTEPPMPRARTPVEFPPLVEIAPDAVTETAPSAPLPTDRAFIPSAPSPPVAIAAVLTVTGPPRL